MPGQKDESHELIARFSAGDEEALRALITEHKESLYRFIYRYVLDRGESDDLVSMVFIRAWNNREGYRPGKALFSTWLFTIATNLCRDHARKKKRHPADFAAGSSDGDDFLLQLAGADFSDSSAEIVAGREEMRNLQETISKLPHPLHTALILHSIEGHSQSETAKILGCSIKTVEMRIYRARKMLRQKLDKTF